MLPTAKRPSAETAVKLQYPGHETATLRQFREEVLRRFRFGWFGRLELCISSFSWLTRLRLGSSVR